MEAAVAVEVALSTKVPMLRVMRYSSPPPTLPLPCRGSCPRWLRRRRGRRGRGGGCRWGSGDEVALEAVEDAAAAAGADCAAEGVVEADADVAGEEVVDAEVAAEALALWLLKRPSMRRSWRRSGSLRREEFLRGDGATTALVSVPARAAVTEHRAWRGWSVFFHVLGNRRWEVGRRKAEGGIGVAFWVGGFYVVKSTATCVRRISDGYGAFSYLRIFVATIHSAHFLRG